MIIVILLCSITLILFQTAALLNNFLTKIKTIYLVDSNNFFDFIVIMFIQFILVHVLLIRQNGDIEMNPWTKTNSSHSFSICHWDLNSLTAHNYLKVSLLRAYVAIMKFDVKCLSVTFGLRNPYFIAALGDFMHQQ